MALKKETKPKAVKKAVAPKAPAAKKPAAKTTAKADSKTASKPAAKGKDNDVEFKTFSPASGSVAVACDFNSWKPIAMKKSKDGNWSVKIKMPKGTHQYKLVFDGQYWEIDKSNPERISDAHGGENSIKRV
ncbi:MAG: glycogen-binding domain-containing protein [Fibromonadaceae bacterium]|jgi:1,4-alpha-glucan branching enzyme|nr:glycogen-binding domain-containing protein [Fibromonadaceae bacterium]